MSQVKVWNDNNHDLYEKFKGKEYHIPAGKFIKMGRNQAIQFKGQYHPIKLDGMKQQMPETMKILRIEESAEEEQVQKWICNADGTEHKTQAALNKYIAKNFADEITDQQFAKKFKKNK